MEAISFSFFRKSFVFGGYNCPQLKPIFLEKAYFFSGSMVEAASFNRNFFLLMEAIPFSVSTFSLVEVIKSYLNT